MSDDDFLSQEDIDALMDGMGADSEETGTAAEEIVHPEPVASAPATSLAGKVAPAFELILRQAATVISTVLNKTTDMNVESSADVTPENIWGGGGQFREKTVSVRVPFAGGIQGDLYLVFSTEDTAKLADLMMMGDGTAEFEEDHKDALAELINQVMGAVSTAMGTEYGITLSTDQVEIEPYGETHTPLGTRSGIVANVSLKIEDFEDSEILLIASEPLAKAFGSYYPDAEESPSETGGLSGLGPETGMGGFEQVGGDAHTATYKTTGDSNIDMLMDVPLDVAIELGRSNVSIRKVLELGPGSIVELDKKASEPVDLMVNDKLVAKGEVVVVDEYFGIRIVSLISPEERIKHLR